MMHGHFSNNNLQTDIFDSGFIKAQKITKSYFYSVKRSR